MKIIYKKLGETPLQTLTRIGKKIKNKKLSYIGRLDPMAEGKMIVLVGDIENKERSRYLKLEKEYIATFVVGVSTDSGDILGIPDLFQKNISIIDDTKIRKAIFEIKKIKIQKYPWLSGKTINGVKMFDLFKSGKYIELKRPSQKVNIKKISEVKFDSISSSVLKKNIQKKISLVSGDFRQKEIIKNWIKFFELAKISNFKKVSFRVRVSSGTFIREFSEFLFKKTGHQFVLYNLKRTHIFL